MYEIYKLENDLYQIHSSFRGDKAMEGTLLAILTYATHKLDFAIEELEFAILDMHNRDTDGSHFGINKTFLYSFNRSLRKTG